MTFGKTYLLLLPLLYLAHLDILGINTREWRANIAGEGKKGVSPDWVTAFSHDSLSVQHLPSPPRCLLTTATLSTLGTFSRGYLIKIS